MKLDLSGIPLGAYGHVHEHHAPNRAPGRTAHRGQSDRPAPRARLISGRLALVLMSSFGALTSFYLLLSVTPMYALSAGAGSSAAGVVTGSLMLATVTAQPTPAIPRTPR